MSTRSPEEHLHALGEAARARLRAAAARGDRRAAKALEDLGEPAPAVSVPPRHWSETEREEGP